jgi:hypothetical protein
MWNVDVDLRRCGCVCSCGGREGAPRPWPVLTLAHGQPCDNNIGDAGARDLGAALQVNTTLTTLE